MVAATVFTLMRSERSTAGDIRFSSMDDLTPILMTSCEISTEAAAELIEFGKEPEIIPMGINECIATISGTFGYFRNGTFIGSASNIFESSHLAPEIRLFYDTIKLFDKISEEDVLYAVKISSKNMEGTKELSNGIWKIKKFVWDRKAKDMGKYRFNMTLSYFWENKQEQKICKVDTGSNVPQSCDFEMAKYSGGSWTEHIEIQNVTIKKSLHTKATAVFDHTEKLEKDTALKIHLRKASVVTNMNIFYGLVTDCDISSNGLYTIRCIGIRDLLNRNVCANPDGGIFAFLSPRVVLPTPYNGKDMKIGQIVKELLSVYYKPHANFSFWKPGNGYCTAKNGSTNLEESEYLPGREPVEGGSAGVKLSTQVLSSMSVGTALTNFLYHQCGFYTWIDYDTGYFGYGFIRNKLHLDITKEIILQSRVVGDTLENTKPDGVIVWDSSAEYLGYDGDIGPDKHVLVYMMDDTKNDIALGSIAHRIMELNSIENQNSYEVDFPAGTVRFKEGDYFDGLGDQTLPRDEAMDWRGGEDADPLFMPDDSVWQIKELTITNKKTTVRIGSSFYSVLDIYKSSLRKMDNGVPMPTKQVQIYTEEIFTGMKEDTTNV